VCQRGADFATRREGPTTHDPPRSSRGAGYLRVSACSVRRGNIASWNVWLESVDTSFEGPTRPALGAWYRDCLGLDADKNGEWRQGSGPTVFATFESETDCFGARAQQTMINFRVRDLDAMLAQLRSMGADVADETQDMEGVGRFGWVTDPEGNRVELWQPA
jgi:catechol 2,3-dioxygenase-like lactoylglutathione lyase family enzyme